MALAPRRSPKEAFMQNQDVVIEKEPKKKGMKEKAPVRGQNTIWFDSTVQ